MEAKSEIWPLSKLLEIYRAGKIIRPRIQRRQCWAETPEGNKTNNADFMQFIRATRNVVSPLIFVQSAGRYVLIDGNNRLNAIVRGATPFDMEISAPVCIFTNLDEAQLISVYEKINITGIKLTANDILAAKASTHLYDEALPDFQALYANHLEYLQSSHEVLPPQITPQLTQYEVLAAKQRMLMKVHPWFADHLLAFCRHRGHNPEHPFDLGGFLADVSAQFSRLEAARGVFPPIGDPQMRLAYTECNRAKYLHYLIYTNMKRGNARILAKSACAYSSARTPRQIAAALNAAPPSRAELTACILSALREYIAPKAPTAKRRAPPKLYTVLLECFHALLMPKIHTGKKTAIEHIIPFSAQFTGSAIDISRLGNLTIIPEDANLSRGNSPLTGEYLTRFSLHYANYPTAEEYCEIIDGRRLLSADKYNAFCAAREERLAGFLADYAWG
jgi:hypothetical protein